MAIEQYFEEGTMAQDRAEEDQSPSKKWKSVLAAALGSDSTNACFDCNICLENAQDPVVTLCGHLYCWPCIYKWLHFQSISPSPDEQHQCPVCKAGISQSTLVPLYGRGQSILPNDYPSKEAFPGLDIPQRPQACGLDAALTSTSSAASRLSPRLRRNRFPMQSQQHQNHNFYNGYTGGLPPAMPSSLHPMVGMFGELVYGRVFGNSMYWYPNSYYHTMSSSPRVRRREMQAEKSLNRISIFLFCCFVLCLLLF